MKVTYIFHLSGSIILIIQSLVGTGSSSSFAAICFLTVKPTPASLLLELVSCSKRKCTYDLPSCHILAILFHKAQLCQHSTLYLFISKAINTVCDVGLYIGVRTFHSTMHKAAVFLSFCLFLAYFLMLVGVRTDQCGFC